MKVVHTSAAVEETFDSLDMRLMCSAPRLEKLLLAALLLETRFTGETLRAVALHVGVGCMKARLLPVGHSTSRAAQQQSGARQSRGCGCHLCPLKRTTDCCSS